MKLESSPKLDSKTSQKSNSKSKSPKIQRAKTCDSKKPTKSKNSSKLKSFIRTIPISIALASALSSQAVANWNRGPCGGVDCTISTDYTTNGNNQNNTNIQSTGTSGTLTIESNRRVTGSTHFQNTDNSLINVTNNSTAAGIVNNGTLSVTGASLRAIRVGNNASLGTLINNGRIYSENAGVLLYGQVGGFLNTGTMIMNAGDAQAFKTVFAIEGQIGADLIFSNQSLTQSNRGARNIIWTQGGSSVSATSLGNIVAKDSSRLEGNFDFNDKFTGESIIFQDSANMTGHISLEGNAKITNGITIGGNSTGGSGSNATLTGNISLNGSSRISKILIDGSNMGGSGTNGTPKLDGNITLNTSNGITNGITIANGGTLDGNINAQSSSSIGGIAINNGSLNGNITMDGTSAIANGITITNGGTYAGRIHTKSQSDIDSITIASGGVVGSNTANSMILSSSNSTIHNIDIQNGGTMYGNIEAHWIDGANARTLQQEDG